MSKSMTQTFDIPSCMPRGLQCWSSQLHDPREHTCQVAEDLGQTLVDEPLSQLQGALLGVVPCSSLCSLAGLLGLLLLLAPCQVQPASHLWLELQGCRVCAESSSGLVLLAPCQVQPAP